MSIFNKAPDRPYGRRVRADRLRKGQRLLSVDYDGSESADMARTAAKLGHWPEITNVSYLRSGEDGHPTYYVAVEGGRGREFPLRPDDKVTVAAD